MNISYKNWFLPPDLSTHGYQIDNLIILVHYLMLVLFIGWGAFMIVALVKFRARPGVKADPVGVTSHANTYFEVGVAIIEVMILVGLAIPVWAELKSNPPTSQQADVEVRVVGEQFAWNIHYPGADGKFGRTAVSLVDQSNPLGLDRDDEAAADDITTINQFHFPVGKTVLVHLTSKDVIHSFNIPSMRVKQDAIPGMTVPMWFKAKETGEGEIACAQLCGLGHYRMKGFFTVDSEEDYQVWLDEQAEAAAFEDDYY
ncbi:MAG: cytochrome c oxidase subunit II [Deltaproteobacteria bacterium]